MEPLDKGTYNYSQPNYSQPLQAIPNSTTVLVLGILSIILAGLIGLILGIIALNMAGNGKAAYEREPSRYTPGSLSNLNGGRVCAIIGVVISSLAFLVLISMLAR